MVFFTTTFGFASTASGDAAGVGSTFGAETRIVGDE